jgi:hypothetical protein
MKDIINKEGYSLTDVDMRFYSPEGSKLLTYKELTKCKTLDEALGSSGILILLYLTTGDHYGHWCTVFKHEFDKNNKKLKIPSIEFFDSYGKVIDEPLKYADKDVRIRNNEVLPYLSKLIYESGYNIEYNDYKLQKSSPDVATCGRHVLVRLACKDMNIDDYVELLFKDKKHDPDYIVTYLTDFLP